MQQFVLNLNLMLGARQNIGMYVVDYQSQRKTYLRT